MKNLREFFNLKKEKRLAWLTVTLIAVLMIVLIGGTKITQQKSAELKDSITETGIKIEDNSSEKISVEKSIEYEKNFEDSYNSTKEESLMVTQMSLNEFNSNNDAEEMINSVESEESSIKYVRNKLYAGEEIIETNSELIKGVTEDLLVETSATKKSYNGVITINKDGSAWSGSGMKIDLSTSSENDTATYTNTVSSGSTATFDNLEETYYIWAGMHDGAKSTMVYTGYTIAVEENDTTTINYYTVTRSQGTGTTLTTKWDSASGTAFTNSPVVLGNNRVTIYASATANSGYHGVKLLEDGKERTASGYNIVIDNDVTISSTAAANIVKVNIFKDGSAWPASGVKLTLYSGSPLTATSFTNTVSASGVSQATFSAVPNGTYTVYAGKDSSNKTDLLSSGVTVTVNDNDPSAVTINYYSLTLQKDLGIEAVSNNEENITTEKQYLYNATETDLQEIEIDAEIKVGCLWSEWEQSGTELAIFNAENRYQKIKMGAGATTLTGKTIYGAAPSITRVDRDTFTYSAISGKAYYISTTQTTTPIAGTTAAQSGFALDTWTTATNTENLNLVQGQVYYVWTKDAVIGGSVSANYNTIAVYKVTRSEGTGTTLYTGIEGTDSEHQGADVTSATILVLADTPFWAISEANTGYRRAKLTVNGEERSALGEKILIKENTTIESSALRNTVKVNIYKDGALWTNSEIKVKLVGSTEYETTVSSGSQASFDLIAEGNYTVYAGKNSVDKTVLVSSGADVSTDTDTIEEINLNYYSLTLEYGTGVSSVSNGRTLTTGAKQYLVQANEESRQAVAIDATLQTGYSWSTWTKTDGIDLVEFSPLVKAQDITMAAGATKLKANAEANSYIIEFNGNGSTSGSTASMTMKYNETKALTANGFSRIGYKFTGWNLKEDGSGSSYTNEQSVSNLTTDNNMVVTMYAQWQANTYTIKYNANGGSGTTEDQTVAYNTNVTLRSCGFTRTGYVFAGWNTSESGTGTMYTAQQVVQGLTSTDGATFNLYAQWAETGYSIGLAEGTININNSEVSAIGTIDAVNVVGTPVAGSVEEKKNTAKVYVYGSAAVKAINLGYSTYGSLQVKDTATVTSVGNNAIDNLAAGSVTVLSGTISANDIGINNVGTGTVSISGGSVTSTNNIAINSNSSGAVSISDGNIDAVKDAINMSGSGNLTVTGGIVRSTSGNGISNSNSITTIGTKDNDPAPNSLEIRGATYGLYPKDKANWKFYDGTIEGKMSAIYNDLVPPGDKETNYDVVHEERKINREIYQIVYLGISNYRVTKDGLTKYYEKLEEAVKGGGTVVVLRDVIDTSDSVIINKDVIIELGVHSIYLDNTPINVNTGGSLVVLGEETGKIINNGDYAIINNGGSVRIGNNTGNIKDYPTIEANKKAIQGKFKFDGGRLVGTDKPPFELGKQSHTRAYCEVITEKVEVRDTNGNVIGTKYESRVRVEETPPEITVTQEAVSDVMTNKDVILTITIRDVETSDLNATTKAVSGINTATIVIDGEKKNLTENSEGIIKLDANGVAKVAVKENQTVIINAEDKAGNVSSMDYTVGNIDRDAGNVVNAEVEGLKPNNEIENVFIMLENIKVDTDDITKIYISNTNTPPTSGTQVGWIPYSYASSYQVPWVLDTESGNGIKYVYIWAIDKAENISLKPYTIVVNMDTELVGGTTIDSTGGTPITTTKNKAIINFVGFDKNLKGHTLIDNKVTYKVGSTTLIGTNIGSRQLTIENSNYNHKKMPAIKFVGTISNIKGVGELKFSVAANTLEDRMGNKNIATGDISTGIQVDTEAPTVTISSTGKVTIITGTNNIAKVTAVTVDGVLVSRDGTGIGTVNVGSVVKVYDEAGNIVTLKR